MTDNLAAGRFHLILAVDVVSDEVRQVVAYLNAGARPGLAAVALGLRYHAEEGVELFMPTVFSGDGSQGFASDSGRSEASTEVSLPAVSDTPEPAGIQAGDVPARPAPVEAPAPAAAPATSGVATGPAPKAAAPPPGHGLHDGTGPRVVLPFCPPGGSGNGGPRHLL